ncbi:carboxy-lyase, partial [Trifolium medium]|nr:carboxy-lyase [Trifolium medium]
AGPGLMDAVTQGALVAGKPVGRFKIGKEAAEWTSSNFHPYLPSENYLTCR